MIDRRWIVAGVVGLLAPYGFPGDYFINLSSQVLISAIFALSLNLLVGYAGLTSLGHAGFLGFAAYVVAWTVTQAHWSHAAAAFTALAGTTLLAALFGLIALRATGLGFLMITLALGQILWGIGFRWSEVTNGDNGLSGLTRPTPFGIDITGATAFYSFSAIVFVAAFAAIALFVHSPFGAAVRGTRDQPRRMSALGYNVWLIRYITFVFAGFWGAVAGLMYVYYHVYIHPASLSLTSSAEALLMAISGGAGTLAGPIVGAVIVMVLKNYVSAYIERWTALLGFVFVLIVLFMPDGLVPGVRRLWHRIRRQEGRSR